MSREHSFANFSDLRLRELFVRALNLIAIHRDQECVGNRSNAVQIFANKFGCFKFCGAEQQLPCRCVFKNHVEN